MSIYENTKYAPNEIGIFTGLPMVTYRASPGLAGSDLETINSSPAKFNRGERTEPTPDMEFGTLFHSLLLGGDADFHTAPEYYPAPESAKKDAPIINKEWNWNAKHCQQWRTDHLDKPIIPRHGPNSSAWLKAMQMKTEEHPLAKGLISQLIPEVSLFARHAEHPILCKGRPDGIIFSGDRTVVVEVKTTRDASTAAFSREILKRGYYKKAAWYRMLLKQLKIAPVEYWFIAVEKKDRPRVNVRRLTDRAMDKGDLDGADSLTLYMKCKLGNYWPEFPDGAFPGESDATPLIDLPDFCYSESDDLIAGLTETPE